MTKEKKYWRSRRSASVLAKHPSSSEVIWIDVQKDAFIGPNIDRELTRLPGLLAWYISLRDVAEDAYREAMFEEHCAEEDIYGEVRAGRKTKGTETEMKMAVRQHPRMREAFRKRMDAEKMFRDLKSACEVIGEKKWVLSSIVRLRTMEYGARDGL